MNNQAGTIFGLSVDAVLDWTNVCYLVSVAAAFFFSVALWRASSISGAHKDSELKKYQAQAQVEIAAAQSLGKAADAKASEAQAVASKANERAAALELEAQQAKLETERLKAKFAWRSLTPWQQSDLIYKLAAQPGNVTVAHTANDPEALYFAILLAKIFEAAKWQVNLRSVTQSGAMLFGIDIPPSTNASISFIEATFSSSGLADFAKEKVANVIMSSGTGDISETSAVVFVGTKPLQLP